MWTLNRKRERDSKTFLTKRLQEYTILVFKKTIFVLTHILKSKVINSSYLSSNIIILLDFSLTVNKMTSNIKFTHIQL
jgi:hypothetical protein